MGYAAAYPLGVVGIILTMILIKKLFKINLEKENEEITGGEKSSEQAAGSPSR